MVKEIIKEDAIEELEEETAVTIPLQQNDGVSNVEKCVRKPSKKII